MAKTKATVARGGSIERDLVRRYARRQQRNFPCSADNRSSGWLVWQKLIDWLNAQPTRTKRKGGIGR